MTDFMDKGNNVVINPDITEIKEILDKIQTHSDSTSPLSGLLTKAYIIELFGIQKAKTIRYLFNITVKKYDNKLLPYFLSH